MNVHLHDYDAGYYPAMPVIEIEVGQQAATPPIRLQAIADSGADATMIPLRYLRQIKAIKSQRAGMLGVTGAREIVDLYAVAIRIGCSHALYVDAVANKINDETIIGRDVLNQFVVTLNGPAHVVEVSE